MDFKTFEMIAANILGFSIICRMEKGKVEKTEF